MRVAIAEGGLDAIGGSFHLCFPLYKLRWPFRLNTPETEGARTKCRARQSVRKRKRREWRKEENKEGGGFKEGQMNRRREGAGWDGNPGVQAIVFCSRCRESSAEQPVGRCGEK